MKRLKLLMISLGCLLLTGGAFVVDASAQGNTNTRRERVHQLIVTRLANGLSLSSSEAQQLGNILKKYQQKKQRLRREARRLTVQLRQDTNAGNSQATQSTLKKLQGTRDQIDRIDELLFSEVKTILTPNQLAQFVLIMDEIRHEVKSVRRRGRRSSPRGNIQSPTFQANPSQQQNTNRPYPQGYWRRGYTTQPQNGVVVGP